MCIKKLIATIGLAVLVLQLINTATIDTAQSFSCTCPKNLRPICGSNNVTYDNDCIFDCAASQTKYLEFQYCGRCEVEANHTIKNDCICPMTRDPVCGNNNREYRNECFLNCLMESNKELKMEHKGRCEKFVLHCV